MISIIIPTLNEENYLPRLLKSIKNQTYNDYEIIVADADSTDKTRQIAKKFNCRIVKGGMPGKARNNGAKAAKGEILLFLDADSIIEKNYLKNSIGEIKKKNLDVAGTYLIPSSKSPIDRIFLSIFNAWIFATQTFYPNASGTGIFCKKSLHEKINGFDEKIKLSEDMDYVKRCGRIGKFRILKSTKIFFSMRRYENEGRLKVGTKLFLSAFYRAFFGEIKNDIFNYNMRYKK